MPNRKDYNEIQFTNIQWLAILFENSFILYTKYNSYGIIPNVDV